MAAKNHSQQIFSNLCSKFTQLINSRTEENRNIINKTLDELNSLNYRYPVVTNSTQAVLLINHSCTFIPPEDFSLVSKCCQLISNLVNRQNIVVEGRTFTIAIQWCFQALKNDINHTTVDVLSAIDGLLRTNTKNLHSLIGDLVHKNSPLVYLSDEKFSLEIVFCALQCLEACTVIDPNYVLPDPTKYSSQFNLLLEIFKKYLSKNCLQSDVIYCKILILCLRAIDNILVHDNNFLKNDIGLYLGFVKSYMVYGIKNIEFLSPQRIMPSSMSIPEPPANLSREKKGGKITRQRKHRTGNKKNPPKTKELIDDESPGNGYNCSQIFDFNSETGLNNALGKIKTSDSDFSDTEGGRIAKLSVNQSRVRQAALHLLFTIIKFSDKYVMFSYWTSFIPENNLSGKHNLMTSILKDPSPRGRLEALNALLLLLSSSKLYLSQAESRGQNDSFTPFSVVLGFMIKELYKCLSLALNENSLPVLTQVLKCFAALVQATPYHRLSPGIIAKVVRNVKTYVYHKDSTVQVAALIVMGCLLASEPVVSETGEILMKNKNSSHSKSESVENKSMQTEISLDDFEYVDFSSEEDESFIDTVNTKVPWIVEKCLNNLGVFLNDETKVVEHTASAPIKLESLQVLSAMSRNYFDSLMAPHLHHITKALDISLSDKNIDLKLHAGRAVDSIGQTMNKYFNSKETEKRISLEQGVYFWQVLLNGSLTSLLQNEQNCNLRAVGCDCIGSIGSPIFEHLPRDKQILCVTLLFGCSKDEEYYVKGAAVRALAICVFYPSLKEDVGFVVDTASAIHTALQDENLTVRIKASWALGNLSDALVNNLEEDIIEELSEDLLLKLFNSCVKCSGDHDKVKMSSVRALGNFLQLVSPSNNLCNVAESGINALVKNASTGSNMKVRWNACYALGNVLKNQALYATSNNWQGIVFKTLTDLVISFRHFKVRINAAVALSCPNKRESYGQHYLHVWTALLKALENSQNIEDFNEYKHRDHLVDQICLTIGHLSRLLTKEDLPQLQDSINFNLEPLTLYINRVSERVVPEKTAILVDALARVNILLKEDNLNSEQIATLRNLTNIFNNLNVNNC